MTSTAFAQTAFPAAKCEGAYKQHLQGICTDGKAAVYWSFTDVLVKTDRKGKLLKSLKVKSHYGDLCHHAGKIYVAVNFGQFNDPNKRADSWVYVHDARDLSFIVRHAVPQLVYGAGGMAFHDGRFFVVGGLPKHLKENYVYEYDAEFRFQKKHVLPSGYTLLGIQTAAFAHGHFWFGCYGGQLLKADAHLKLAGSYRFDCSLGIEDNGNKGFLVARRVNLPDNLQTGATDLASQDAEKGLRKQSK